MKYKTVPGRILTSVCGRYFLVTPDESLEINEPAAYYWKKLEEGASEADLFDLACDCYDVEDPELLKNDIHDLVLSLLKKRLLTGCVA